METWKPMLVFRDDTWLSFVQEKWRDLNKCKKKIILVFQAINERHDYGELKKIQKKMVISHH